jgi:hypothetical protein
MLEQYRGYWISGKAGLVHPFSPESYPAGQIYSRPVARAGARPFAFQLLGKVKARAMAKVINIPPNFGAKQFDTAAEAREFLTRFGFEMIRIRSDYDLWETKKTPKRRAIFYRSKAGRYVAAQLIVSKRR